MAFSMAWQRGGVEGCGPVAGGQDGAAALGLLAGFRAEVYRCFTARADALFELAKSALCAEGPVKTLVGLSLAPEHRRGHGILYDAVNAGQIGCSSTASGSCRSCWSWSRS